MRSPDGGDLESLIDGARRLRAFALSRRQSRHGPQMYFTKMTVTLSLPPLSQAA